MKDELGESIMRKFVGLRSKMYSLECDNKSMTKAKGAKRYDQPQISQFEAEEKYYDE